MSDNARVPSLTAEIDTVLRDWAKAQNPDLKVEDYRVCFFVQPAQHREGAFFVPGELALCRLADAPEAEGESPRPRLLSVWSYELKREVLIPPAWIRLERAPREAPVAPAPQP